VLVPGVSSGWLPRRHGLAATILAADGVTADSQPVRAGRNHNPDRLAVRGAGTRAMARGKTRPLGGANRR